MHPLTPPSSEYRTDIDGLRALAVLSVFLFHLQPDLLAGGFLGVDVFFVISGYLITGIILRKSYQHHFSFLHFYARRIKRIFPALFVVLVLSSLAAVVLLVPDSYVNFMKSARYAAGQLANFYFSQEVGYFSEGFAKQPLLHTWSLGVEEQFYLFWPFLLFLCFRFFKPSKSPAAGRVGNINGKIAVVLLLILLVSGWSCYVLAVLDYNLAFYMFYARAFEFCIGGFLTLGMVPEPRSKAGNLLVGLVGMSLLLYSLFFVHEEYLGKSFLQGGVWIACLGSALLLLVNWKKSIVNRLLAMRMMSFIGKISYSLYLYHWPVIIFYKVYANVTELSFGAAVCIVLVSFFLAILSYLLVEQPVRRTALSDIRVVVAALVLIACFAISFKILENSENAPWRIGRYETGNLERPVLQYDEGCRMSLQDELYQFQCQKGMEGKAPVIALVGDSHAPHFSFAVTSWARKNGFDVKYVGCPGCPMLLGNISIEQNMLAKAYEEKCISSRAVLQSEIVDDPNVKIILIAQRFDLFYDGRGAAASSAKMFFKNPDGKRVDDPTSYYRKQLVATISAMQAAGKQVIIMKQVPIFSDIDSCNWETISKRIGSQERVCEYDNEFIEQWQQPSVDFVDELAAFLDVQLVDSASCMKSPVSNGVNLYYNSDHLNTEGVRLLAPCFERAMDRLIRRP